MMNFIGCVGSLVEDTGLSDVEFDFGVVAQIIYTRRVPVQRAVERDEIPYPYKVHDTTLHSRA